MENFDVREMRYPNAAALAGALAAEIASELQAALHRGRTPSLAVPGGRTPIALFERLCAEALDWRRVWITLVDERWVSPGSPSSNEKLVREHLLQKRAAGAQFVGLKSDADDARSGANASWAALNAVPRPFARVVLGMGEDGHIASLFPDSPGLATALDPAHAPGCVAMTAPGPPQARISLNLAALLQSQRISLLLVGVSKWTTYERARLRGPAVDMPVRALWQQRSVPVTVYWSP